MTESYKHCPNCGTDKITIEGNHIICPVCDAKFKITTEGPRVEQTGLVTDLQERVKKIETLLSDPSRLQAPSQTRLPADDDIVTLAGGDEDTLPEVGIERIDDEEPTKT
jgi:uncharacterized Zn finger protein (UPF0148 family)